MQCKPTHSQPASMPRGAVRRMADGGMFDKFKQTLGMKAAPTTTAPPVAPAASNPNLAGISGYANMSAQQRREKAAGLADGGQPYRKGSKSGGAVRGKGTGISDSVPAMYSKGEYVLPADTTKAIGIDKLDEIRHATHTPAAQQRAAAGKKSIPAAKGAVRKMADGGMQYDEMGNPIGPKAGPVQAFNTAPAGATIRSMAQGAGNYLKNMPVASVARGTAEDVSRLAGQGQYAQALGIGLRGAAALPVAAATGSLPGLATGAATALGASAVDVGKAFLTGETGMQASVQTKPPASTVPAAAGASRPTTPVTAPAAIAPTAQQPTAPAAPAPPTVNLAGQAGQDMGNGISKFNQGGKTLYSNVPGPDNDKLMSNRPGVSVMPGMARSEIDATLGGMSAAQTSNENAIRAANLRDGVDMNRGTAQGMAETAAARMQELASSQAGTPGRDFAQKQLLGTMEQNTVKRAQDINQGQFAARLGMDRNKANRDDQGASLDNQAKSQLLAAQKAYGLAKTPEEKAQAEQALRGVTNNLQKEFPNKFIAVPRGKNADGLDMGSDLFNGQTEQFVEQPKAQASPPALPPKEQLVKNQTYPTPRGPAVWDGTKFTPVK